MGQVAMELWRGCDAVIRCADNLEFMQDLPDEGMHLIITSPPYNIGKAYERRSSLDVYLEAQERVIAESVRLLNPKGSLCWEVGNHISKDGEVIPLDIVLYPLFKRYGLRLRNRIVWHYEHGLHAQSDSLAATKRSSGSQKVTITPLILIQFVCLPSILAKNTSKGRKLANYQEIRLAKIRAMFG